MSSVKTIVKKSCTEKYAYRLQYYRFINIIKFMFYSDYVCRTLYSSLYLLDGNLQELKLCANTLRRSNLRLLK